MRIRRATGDDDELLALARVFVRSATSLTERYYPEQLEHFPGEPEGRLPLYRHLFSTGAVLVADDPEPVGFAAAIVRDRVWFLSQLWVVPERQGSGIGSVLLDEALAWGRGANTFTVVSSAHPAAQRLYMRASMLPLWVQVDLTGDEGSGSGGPERFTELEPSDQEWVDQLDREVRGVARPEDHAFWLEEAEGVALRRGGGPAGYVYARPGGKIGPGAVRDPADIPALLSAARELAGGPATVAVPSTNWAALRELMRAGFSPSGTNLFLASRPLPDGGRYLSSGGGLG